MRAKYKRFRKQKRGDQQIHCIILGVDTSATSSSDVQCSMVYIELSSLRRLSSFTLVCFFGTVYTHHLVSRPFSYCDKVHEKEKNGDWSALYVNCYAFHTAVKAISSMGRKEEI